MSTIPCRLELLDEHESGLLHACGALVDVGLDRIVSHGVLAEQHKILLNSRHHQ